MKKIILQVIGVGGILGAIAPAVFAVDPTPTTYVVDASASQLMVNGVASIQSTLFSIAGLIWPYALGVLLFFLVIRFGMSFFRHH